LSDLEVNDPSAPDINHVEDTCRSISSMIPTALDPNDNLPHHLLAIFRSDLPREGDSRDGQFFGGINCGRGERDSLDVH
jgi:hypothetical protein